MNFVRRREVKGIKKNVEKENEKRMNKKKKKGKKREEGILFCSRRGNRSDFEIPRDSANCDLQCGKRKTSPPPFHPTIQITRVTNVELEIKIIS